MPLPVAVSPAVPSGISRDGSGKIVKRKVKGVNGLAFILDGVFTPQECATIISWTEELGYVKAALGNGTEVVESVRKSHRCLMDTKEFANIIYERILPFLPAEWNGHSILELNERLRCLRYDKGGYFRKHADGYYEREDYSARSYITIQFYLNEGFEGGETTFIPNRKERVPCVPKTGRILVFEHPLIHEGSKLLSGRKYTIRTDVMYSNIQEDLNEDLNVDFQF